MLDQPVLGPGKFIFRHRGGPGIKTCKEVTVFFKMVSNVVIRHSLLEQSFFKSEMVMVLHNSEFQIFFIVFSLNKKNSIKKSSVLIIYLWHLHSEALIPSVRVRNREDDPSRGEANSKEETGQSGHGEDDLLFQGKGSRSVV